VLTAERILPFALLVSAGLTTAIFALLQRLKRQTYVSLWAWGWALLTAHYLGPVFASWRGTAGWSGVLAILSEWLLAMAGLLFLTAAQAYAQTAPPVRTITAAGAVFALWAVVYERHWFPVAPDLGIGLVLFAVAWSFWQEGRKQESLADELLAAAFGFWGALVLARVFGERSAFPLARDAGVVVVIPQLFVAGLMIMALYEEEKRRIERNMLALSNLNLATSSILGGEIQQRLVQALERVLSVVRIPCGVLCLHYGDPLGPNSVVTAGLKESFCAELQEHDLDNFLVKQVARLGGLVVFRDLTQEAKWAVLEQQDKFRQFRKLVLGQGLQTVAAISLQARERVFGTLVLGTYESRRFASAELRLLLALGHQIGMAVENSYLVQQAARRAEELNVLNEIGRTLSSTLDRSALFEKILAEMRRLFDVANFYIAFYDNARDEIRFELEVADGERKPKRSRPAGNHLTEYLIRTRQPLLIREDFAEQTRQLGVQPVRQTGCYCGVPLVAYDRAVGVMAAYSPQERVLDEGHLELLRLLASEASIAIENARLFGEERKKSRHLTLLNNVSRHGIATLNPEEILAKIAGEMQEFLTYDYIGIGVMQGASKEVVIQAEVGKRRGEHSALGRRIRLEQGLVGQVACTGQVIALRQVTEAGPEPLFSNSISAIGLPIIYADQLLGVLVLEASEPCDFPEEETLLLRTLADVIAGALHNALTFQKAQEQAITDGLTGVKTHRFFMEALSAEWKRATRAGRPFSLVLMDLDRFKFVNDFYGHLEGDAVMQRIGQVLEQNCRRSDVVARYGGDEFVILMPETNVEQSRQLANKLRGCINSDPELQEKNITASFGIATFPQHGSTPQELIQVADASMYLSKHQGGNAVSTAEHYDPKQAKTWKRDVLEAYLGVTLKRLFSTGPEAFEEVYRRLQQFTQSLPMARLVPGKEGAEPPGAAAEHDASFALSELNPAVIETVTSLAFAVDAKDHYTQGHSQKVSAYAVLLAQGLANGAASPAGNHSLAPGSYRPTPPEMEEIRLAALLHDVGKVGIPEAVLNKMGPLDEDEWEVMKRHATLGAKILEPLRGISRIREMVKYHHEFYDGSGYPEGLAGQKIPLGARIISVADAYDTITSDRTYKKARTVEEAFAELERCAGTQFDPELVRVFIQTMRRQPHPIVEVAAP